VRFHPEPIPSGVAQVDAARVRQVLLNLLSNAVKFTPTDGLVTLRLGTTGRALSAEVVDTGIGIPDDQRSRVFGMFERLHEGRSDATGTGLGLAISKRLVELHGGTIDFESVPGSGTRFWFSIPGVIIEPQVGPRVLVVEDDTRDADLLAELAREAGHRVEIAPTAASAMSAIARSAPTAVILDLRLPDRRGDGVLVALKTDPRTARIPVLVVTVEDDDGGARVLGADDHMTKPIQTERVRGWLQKTIAEEAVGARAAG
jgi:CheY-like chemotaxis protein